MSTQHKLTGEWTGLSLSRLIKENGYKGAADAHNAALDAKDAYIAEIRTTTYSDLEQQVYAEREKVKGLHEACRAESNHSSKLREQLAAAQAALAKVKEGK